MSNKIFFRFILISVLFFRSASLAFGAEFTIQMDENGFSPNSLTIHVGDVVSFHNQGVEDHWPASNNHPTHTLYPEFDPKRPINPSQTWQFTFEKVGKWGLHDHLYPTHTGTITVVSSGDTKAPQSDSVKTLERKTLKDTLQNFFNSVVGYFKNLFKKPEIKQTVKISGFQFKNGPPPESQLEALYQNFSFNCSGNDFTCISKSLETETDKHGPWVAISILQKLQADGKVLPSVDEHQLAHRIGRETAKVFGMNSEAFLLCPMSSYNGGCQHGFFEYVLGKAHSAKDAAIQICSSLEGESYSAKQQFDCYHGVGHGIMMAALYNLNAALDICNTLPLYSQQDGCWQGVFMENVNGVLTGYTSQNDFSLQDPLAPCDTVESKYRHECFVNHAGWLMKFFKNDVGKASQACLKAPDGNSVEACLESVGLMASNPSWQPALLSKPATTLEQNTWNVCLKFSPKTRNACIIGAVDNLMNFKGSDLTSVKKFCDMVSPEFSNQCFKSIGLNLQRQSTNIEDAKSLCKTLGSFEKDCLEGLLP